jgi:Xaa-Pro aminopeptidase
MKTDIDALMQARKFDAILIVGHAEHNPPMYYMTGGGHVSHAALIKPYGKPAILFCNDMEREEAAKSGLQTIPFSNYPYKELLDKANGDVALAAAFRYQRMFKDCGLNAGRVGIYGTYDVSSIVAVLEHLRSLIPELAIIGEARENSLFMYAMETKDEAEVERIRRVGKATTEVVSKTSQYLTSCDVGADEVLLKEDGSALTIGDMKGKINLWLAERSVEPAEGFIFAIGRDAGVPHSTGNPVDLMRLGQTIVFDIYPAEQGGGYFYDFTRTWSLGYATPEMEKLYAEVKSVYQKATENLDLNAPFKDYQRLVCEEYEKGGHKTPLKNPETNEGYVHSLGHGVGLNIHERPWSGLTATDDNLLRPGVVITIEPGLYYPDKGMGFRIEDTYWVRPDGKIELLVEYPYDFVLPMKKWKKK